MSGYGTVDVIKSSDLLAKNRGYLRPVGIHVIQHHFCDAMRRIIWMRKNLLAQILSEQYHLTDILLMNPAQLLTESLSASLLMKITKVIKPIRIAEWVAEISPCIVIWITVLTTYVSRKRRSSVNFYCRIPLFSIRLNIVVIIAFQRNCDFQFVDTMIISINLWIILK